MKLLKQIFCIGIFMLILFCQCTRANAFNKIDSNITRTADEKSVTHVNAITYQKKGPLKSFWHWITAPLRPVWGRYEEDNNKIDAPYSTFLNAYESTEVEKIRYNITEGKYRYKVIYSELYSSIEANTGGSTLKKEFSLEAKYAKNAAFVYLIGLDTNGVPMDSAARNTFKRYAITILKNIKDDADRFDHFDEQMYRGKELLQYLQAHDYLMYGSRIWGDTYDERDDIEGILHDFTYELYRKANNAGGSLRRYQNHSLIAAGAIGMAAIVLHHNGVGLLQNQRKPNRWANAAHAYTSLTLWNVSEDNPMVTGPNSKKGEIAGYAEGPGYFSYGFRACLPFFRAYNNFVGDKETNNTYYKSAWQDLWEFESKGEDVKNYFYDDNIDNLFEWYIGILQPNGDEPSYDDTRGGKSMAIEIVGKPKYATRPPNLIYFDDPVDLSADYLAVFNHYDSSSNISPLNYTYFPNSGNIIVHSLKDASGARLPLSQTHSIHVLCESGVNLNGIKPLDLGHEHADATSFIITAGEDILAIDPGYTGYPNRFDVNQGHHHNVITSTGIHPKYATPTTVIMPPLKLGNKTDFAVYSSYEDYDHVGLNVTRKFSMRVGEKPYPYYVIQDSVYADSGAYSIVFNFNGNGNKDASPPTARALNSHTVIFDHPCEKDSILANKADNWKLRVTTSGNVYGLNPGTTAGLINGSTHYSIPLRKYDNSQLLKAGYGNVCITTSGGDEGEHSRAKTTLVLGWGGANRGKFLTIIEPLPCPVDDNADLPIVVEGDGHTVQTIKNSGVDATGILHYSRAFNAGSDTVINPFRIDGSAALLTVDAENAGMSYSQNNELRNAYCVTYTNFRKCGFDNGNLLIYDDTVYIESDHNVDVEYKITGKANYSGYCKTGDTATTVEFYLAGMDYGVNMLATGGVLYSYDTITSVMTVDFPANQLIRFDFKPTDPCKTSCYYPDTATNVVTTFTHGDETSQVLSHHLKILLNSVDTGRLNIYNGSQMHICENKYLLNQDSLIVLKTGLTQAIDLKKCDPSQMYGALVSGAEGDRRSALIVENKAALVLDANSFTSIGANSTLYVRNGGSLIIKAGAVVEIGSRHSGFGEILMEDNSYLCVEEGADIHFYADSTDTVDDNRFYVMLNEYRSNNPPLEKTHTGIQPEMEQTLIDSGLITWNHACTEPCSFSSIMPPWGIYNRQWGYSNFVTPLATFTVSGDTLCPGDSVTMYLTKILNEAEYKIRVCHLDSSGQNGECELNPIDTGITIDKSWIVDYPYCQEPNFAPEKIKFLLKDTGWYKIHVWVKNECGVEHDTIKKVYVPAKPDVVFTATDGACPGYGTVIADGSSSISHLNHNQHTWTVALITPDSLLEEYGEPFEYGADWEFDSSHVRNNFDFPGFRWIGGFQYAVGLTVNGWCGNVTKWDTISLPLMVMIDAEYTRNYLDPLGPPAFKIKGYVEGATSWNWSPTTYMDDPYSLNPTVSPSDSIAYILTGISTGCTSRDTITISHNNMAYAGMDTSICRGDTVLLGTEFDAALFLGFLYHVNKESFAGIYESFYSNGLRFHTNFTHFMIHNLIGAGYTWMDQFVTVQSLRNEVRKESWYSSYYEQFMADPADLSAFIYFDENLPSGMSSDILSHLPWNGMEVEQMFEDYETYVSGNPAECIWEHKSLADTAWTYNSDWDNHFNILVEPTEHTTYRITVIDPSLSQIEYDEVTVYADTVITVGFAPSYQMDSTIYFANYTGGDESNTISSYKWYFGDGDSSSYVNPSHRFPAFDAVYFVCLQATNACGTYEYCDSVRVDSSFFLNGGFYKNGNGNDSLEQDIARSTKSLIQNNQTNENYLSVNVPNPFSGLTMIEYATKDQNRNAEVRITNILGQHIKTYSLPGSKGVLVVDGSILKDGMYFYSLIVDDIICESKRMLVRH